MTEADLGFADAFIHGDFSLQDNEQGLLNLMMIFVANKESSSSISLMNDKRGWLASAKYLLKHVLRRNTVTQARRNIARHYDLSNQLFELFMDETMTYSCAVFKTEDEDLKLAQERKLISKEHEVLELGCGWGSLAIEAVKRTGCKYTAITLSEEQWKYCEARAKKEGVQIKFLHCDYRKLPKTCKFDRIICCEMTEHCGDEYLEEFFRCCESLLAEDGLFVLQVAEHVENIGGSSYAQTLICWRKKFLKNKSQAWAMAKEYQVVFSRQGNFAALGDPYQGFPSAFSS
ncbi:Mycolic acid cyclopropane synthase [Corchorus olitorius]|uniref:Mycolic acid cyclopropane synthase n=1 Tax=Corchorus olitorius TaxID=93759 RepID=A0A1R3HZJ5_9ROSI|nr:Mycolic acid cyclopropane synthase [Corchorus olitorius]